MRNDVRRATVDFTYRGEATAFETITRRGHTCGVREFDDPLQKSRILLRSRNRAATSPCIGAKMVMISAR